MGGASPRRARPFRCQLGQRMSAALDFVERLAMEPPLRIVARAALGMLPVPVTTRARWELSRRPAYLVGVLEAARQARRQNVPEISVIEFGVAGGDGLVTLQHEAAAV